MSQIPVAEVFETFENLSFCFEEMCCNFCEFSRDPDLEYDDMQPDEDGLTFSEYHVLEW